MGANHELNSVTIFLDDDGVGKTKPKQVFRSTWNTFKKLLPVVYQPQGRWVKNYKREISWLFVNG